MKERFMDHTATTHPTPRPLEGPATRLCLLLLTALCAAMFLPALGSMPLVDPVISAVRPERVPVMVWPFTSGMNTPIIRGSFWNVHSISSRVFP